MNTKDNNNTEKLKVIICGAAGNMGTMTAKTILAQQDLHLVGACDINGVGTPVVKDSDKTDIPLITDNLKTLIEETSPNVLVDFTKGHVAPANIIAALNRGVACVVGTTGISPEDLQIIKTLAEQKEVPVLLVPNFSIGAVLLMRFAKDTSKFFEWAEIIELHHNKKADAPSGTALRTAEMMHEVREKFQSPASETEKVQGARGATYQNIHIHSVRLPGLLAHQEVIFGGTGETLTLRHDSLTRECFMPGVVLAVKNVNNLQGLVVGLEHVM